MSHKKAQKAHNVKSERRVKGRRDLVSASQSEKSFFVFYVPFCG
jgi:hypothetical protein